MRPRFDCGAPPPRRLQRHRLSSRCCCCCCEQKTMTTSAGCIFRSRGTPPPAPVGLHVVPFQGLGSQGSCHQEETRRQLKEHSAAALRTTFIIMCSLHCLNITVQTSAWHRHAHSPYAHFTSLRAAHSRCSPARLAARPCSVAPRLSPSRCRESRARRTPQSMAGICVHIATKEILNEMMEPILIVHLITFSFPPVPSLRLSVCATSFCLLSSFTWAIAEPSSFRLNFGPRKKSDANGVLGKSFSEFWQQQPPPKQPLPPASLLKKPLFRAAANGNFEASMPRAAKLPAKDECARLCANSK